MGLNLFFFSGSKHEKVTTREPGKTGENILQENKQLMESMCMYTLMVTHMLL